MSVEVLWFPSLTHAWDAYAGVDSMVLVDVDGEAYEVNGSRRNARLVDSGPRQRGERCYMCGTKRPVPSPDPAVPPVGFVVGPHWLCCDGCRIDHHDNFAEPRGSDDTEGAES